MVRLPFINKINADYPSISDGLSVWGIEAPFAKNGCAAFGAGRYVIMTKCLAQNNKKIFPGFR
jgi:hypothetical protein